MSTKKKKPVSVASKWCKGCGICIKYCPTQVLEYDEEGKAKLKDAEACTRCGLCELRCPDFAIVVNKEDESDEN